MVIFLCRDSLEGILCGVYDAWMSRLGHDNVKLQLDSEYNYEMFAEYRKAEITEAKTEKVIRSIRSKISEDAYRYVYRAALSEEKGKADLIYRFLIYGFHLGKPVLDTLKLPPVHEIFRLNRAVANEAHLLIEFLRFSQLPEGVLFGVIGPKNDVTSLLMPHFADRLRGERFIIYDEKRKKAGVHREGVRWYLLEGEEAKALDSLVGMTDEGAYASLWKAFFYSVSIRERENYVCQRGHLPLRFRSYMTEFQGTV